MDRIAFAKPLPRTEDNNTLNENEITTGCWKIIISDDEEQVHKITELALSHFEFEGKTIQFISAFNIDQTIAAITENPDTAIILQDVVMETDNAGLDIVHFIRQTLHNKHVRIILRTGQPGQAPERQVIVDYDINDYKEKTELTSQKLFTLIYSSLRSYRDIINIERNKSGLQRVIDYTSEVFRHDSEADYIKSAQDKLSALILQGENQLSSLSTVQIVKNNGQSVVQAATGCYQHEIGKLPQQIFNNDTIKHIKSCFRHRKNLYTPELCLAYLSGRNDSEYILLFSGDFILSQIDQSLIELYSRQITVVFDNLSLHKEIEKSQQEIVNILGTSIETRSKETGNHIKRVAEFSVLLARKLGFSSNKICLLRLASPLHDFGKIGIPDSILNKPGKLDKDEWDIMMTHARIGYDMLIHSDSDILQAGAIISHEHHEKWNGSGYPQGKKGEDIHIYGRITAVADVFDALACKRCYKDAWKIEDILTFFSEQRGQHFDPTLVDILFEELEQFKEILELYKD